MRVFVPGDAERRECCSRSRREPACRCAICARACRRSRTCSRRRWGRSRHAAFTTRAIRADYGRRYGGTRTPGGGVGGDRRGPGSGRCVRKRAFIGLLLFALAAVPRPRRADLRQRELSRRWRCSAPTAETFRQFLEQQDFFVFFITVYVGAGLIANDRRANALQIYLSKPLTRVEYIVRQARRAAAFLLLVTWCRRCCCCCCRSLFAGSFTFLRNNLFLFPAITVARLLAGRCWRRSRCWRCRRCRRAAASSASCTPAIIFFTAAIYGVLYAVTGSSARLVDVDRRQPRAGRRRRSSACRRATTRPGRSRCS